jgi:hypothetical protein
MYILTLFVKKTFHLQEEQKSENKFRAKLNMGTSPVV